MTDTKIISRISKLLALARDGGATQHEAEMAMAKAQELMAENSLSLAMMEARTGNVEEGRTKEQTDKRAMYKWQRNLMEKLAYVNFCHLQIRYGHVYKVSGKAKPIGYEIIGRESAVVAAQGMFDYLLSTISRLVMVEVGGDRTQHLSRSAVSFREGCSDRICARLQQRHDDWMREQARKARESNQRSGATANALVVVMSDWAQTEKDLNNDFVRGWAPGTTAKARAEGEAKWSAAEAKRKVDKARYVAEGIDPEVADWMSVGYPRTMAEGMVAETRREAKPETEAQRRRREEREERDSRRYWQRQARQSANRDYRAYVRGEEAGDRVGLDAQIDKGEEQRKIG